MIQFVERQLSLKQLEEILTKHYGLISHVGIDEDVVSFVQYYETDQTHTHTMYDERFVPEVD